ncbi:MAG: DUF4357 domain-containing protein [Selenomonadaceae bacterium]|nr:DUF4357 domain-containing protein [Selenomonadaceae bacterium]
MANDTNINLIVRDEITTCTDDNDVEIICKIPRNNLVACKDITELKHGGIYFLFGKRDNRQFIYIGHAVGELFKKICEHDKKADKDFFTEAIVLTTADNSFGARELIWLEDKFFDELKNTEYLVVKIDDDKQTNDFEVHAEFARTALDILCYKIFEPSPKFDAPDEEIFYLKRYVKRIDRTINAKMKRTPTGYRVLAGSKIFPLLGKDNSSKLIKKRRQAASVDANNKLLKDEEFSSPSSAAEFVLGLSANGCENWKTKDGVTLSDFLRR